MIRLLLAVLGLVLAALLSLTALWLLGELVSGLGQVLTTTASLLLGVLRFALTAGVLGGLAYILTSAWGRPHR
ncbi:hypothetical protein EHF33_04705 [Deinococcus psychrotolerans]|uniref:Uncharacterized protein n=2 Tax=Deinococcus TaxID=1298 RepID=A0A553V1K4_9DEIO|nr:MULTISPECIES: hypothetical protein [Deinococcus]AZI42131.1 hypothetical protein EHF33_04705 [Deinococcus psychrotolerans]TSA86091.1 hypothetical protein FNU79_07840 [Deinococcus detaillensis]